MLNGAPLVGGLSLPRHARLLALPGVGEVAVGLALPSVMRRMLRKGIADGAEPDQAWFDDISARFDQGTQRAVLRLFRAATPAAREQAGRELRELDVPALVVHGERDPWHPPRTGQAYAAVLPQSELLELPAAGHWPWLEDSGCRRARPRVPAPLSPGHQGITFVGCSCDSARPPAGSSRTGPSTSSARSRCSPRRTTSTGSPAASRTTPARRRPRSTTRATSSTSSGRSTSSSSPSVQTFVSGERWLADITSWMYINAQTSITLGALAWIYLRRNPSFYFVRNMFLVAFGIALIGYTLFPTAPPRFLPEWGFIDTVAQFTGVPQDSVTVDALFNPYAAVPSMHAGFAIMIGWPLARLVKPKVLKVFWASYPLIVTFVIVATANHFLADAFLGACTAGLGALAAVWLARVRPAAWSFRAGAKQTAPA